jgi:hypothetical protein
MRLRAECWALRKVELGYSFGGAAVAGQSQFLLADLVPYFMLPPEAQACYKAACREVFKCVYMNGFEVVHTRIRGREVGGRKRQEQEDLSFVNRLIATEASFSTSTNTGLVKTSGAAVLPPQHRLQPLTGAGTPLRIDLLVGYTFRTRHCLMPAVWYGLGPIRLWSHFCLCSLVDDALQALSALEGQLASKRLQMVTSRAVLSSKAARRVSVIALGGRPGGNEHSRAVQRRSSMLPGWGCSVEVVLKSWLFAVLNGARCQQFALQFRARAAKLNALKGLGFWRMRLRAHRRRCHATRIQRFFRGLPMTSHFRYLISKHQQALKKVQKRMRSYAAVTTARQAAIARLWMQPAATATTGSAAPFIKEFSTAMMDVGGDAAVPRMKEAVRAFLFSRRLAHKTSPAMDDYREAVSMLKFQQQVKLDHGVALQAAKRKGCGRKESNHTIFKALDKAFTSEPQIRHPMLPVMRILSGPQYERQQVSQSSQQQQHKAKTNVRRRIRAATAAAIFLGKECHRTSLS